MRFQRQSYQRVKNLPVRRLRYTKRFIQVGIYLRNWSPRTVRTYRQGLATLAIERPIKAELDAWVVGLRERRLTPGGCNMYIRSVNSYLTMPSQFEPESARLEAIA